MRLLPHKASVNANEGGFSTLPELPDARIQEEQEEQEARLVLPISPHFVSEMNR
jgi:hypothetical protein